MENVISKMIKALYVEYLRPFRIRSRAMIRNTGAVPVSLARYCRRGGSSVRIGVISDIHGNYVAMRTVLDEMGEINSLWCLGDLVGYGPQPNEVH